ncbi:hypothetical protein EJ110_NYTH19784 [Nymphaea thermarum]|nr:hypothetical protein EJ110_NYTH19784 [Nymphaea thermarum]
MARRVLTMRISSCSLDDSALLLTNGEKTNALDSAPGRSTSLCMGCWWRQNGDVGVDGMFINIASLLPGMVTNPYKSAYFQGTTSASLEAASAYAGIHGKNAYPSLCGLVVVYPNNFLNPVPFQFNHTCDTSE